jgi:hypothetical protein
MTRLIVAIFTIIALAACGGGGGGGSTPAARPDGNVNGTAFDNVLINSNIEVYSLDGSLLGTGTTDEDGLYSVTLDSVPSQIVKIVASGGQYKEEATNTIVELEADDHLYAYVNYSQGGDVTTAVTLFTTIAAGYAEYLMGLGVNATKAVEDANSSISQLVGVDIVNVQPVDITDATNSAPSLTNALRYSFFTAAVSPFTAYVSRENGRTEHDFYNSIMFAQLAYEDIRHDGYLNGQSAKGNVSMGVVPFDEETYRNKLALNTLVIANSANNQTGLSPAELKDAAEAYNNSNHVAFGNVPPVSLDADKPIVTNPSWFSGETVAGNVSLAADVSDVVGVSTAVFTIDGTDFVAADPENPEVSFDSTTFSDAVYPVTLTVENFAGATTNFTRNLTIANAGITISNVRPADGEHIRGTFDFRATVTDPIAVADVLFKLDENTQYSPQDLNNPTEPVDTTQVLITEGEHDFEIVAENQGGFTDTYTGTFVIDNTDPVISWPLPDDSYQTGNFDFTATLTDNIELASAKLFWDGDELTDFVQGGNPTQLDPSYTINALQDFEGPHTLAIQVSDRAGGQVTETKTVNLDWNPPQVSIQTPSGLDHGGPYEVTWTSFDTNGLAEHRVVVDGNTRATVGSDATSATITPEGPEGAKTLQVIAVDNAGKETSSSILVKEMHLPPQITKLSGSYSSPSLGGSPQTGVYNIPGTTELTFEVNNEDWQVYDISFKDTTYQPGNAPLAGVTKDGVTGEFSSTCNYNNTGDAYYGTWSVRLVDQYGLVSDPVSQYGCKDSRH